MYVTILKDPIASGGLCPLDTLLQRFTTVFSTSPHKILDPPMYTKGFYFDISLMLMIINIVGTYVCICSFQYNYCTKSPSIICKGKLLAILGTVVAKCNLLWNAAFHFLSLIELTY